MENRPHLSDIEKKTYTTYGGSYQYQNQRGSYWTVYQSYNGLNVEDFPLIRFSGAYYNVPDLSYKGEPPTKEKIEEWITSHGAKLNDSDTISYYGDSNFD